MMNTSAIRSVASAASMASKSISKQFAAILLASACGVLATGSVASAGTVQISSAGIYSDNQLIVDGNDVYASAIGLTQQGSNALFWVFCVDFTHDISVGVGGQYTFGSPLTYTTGLVTTNSIPSAASGSPLTTAQQQEIQYLASFGVGLANAGGAPTSWNSTLNDELTAVQGAIWKVEYNYTITGGTGNQLSLISQYVSDAGKYVGLHPDAALAPGLFSPDAQAPANLYQAFATGAVPEPSTWAMMILGFCGLGFMGYRRKAKSVSVAA
jgi:hypothetical protein